MTAADTVSKIMTRKVFTANSSDTVATALQILAKRSIGSVVIVNNGKPVGILTERDLVKQIAKDKEVLDQRIEAVMRHPLITVSPETPVFEALQIMRKNDIRRLPVISGERLQGIVTVHRDLVYWALKAGAELSTVESGPKLKQG
jgi:CBS domain-containing protein